MESSHTEIRCQGLGTMANGSPDSQSAGLPDRCPRNRHGSLWIRPWRSCRIPQRAGLVIVRVIPVADPFPDIPGHVINTIGALSVFKHPHRRQRAMVVPMLLASRSQKTSLDAHSPRDRSGHLSPAPPSPVLLRSAGACRPMCSMRTHPPNPH